MRPIVPSMGSSSPEPPHPAESHHSLALRFEIALTLRKNRGDQPCRRTTYGLAQGARHRQRLGGLPLVGYSARYGRSREESDVQVCLAHERRYGVPVMAQSDLETLEIVPDPVSLIESMRAVGYTTESAIADLVDNSISAEAARVAIEYDATGEPYVAILDDGRGMSASELTQAMRHGSRNPADRRHPNDLGRFGLGLKTASLSQCRVLTVISKQGGDLSARCWDLDVVQDSGRWLVVVPTTQTLQKLPMFSQLAAMDKGTLVVWQNFDRLSAGSTNLAREFTTKFAGLREHLALVFHRFTSREEGAQPVSIRLNGLALPSRDPFIRGNSYRQPLEGQIIRHERGQVCVTPHVLPPVSHLSPEDIEVAGGLEGLRGTQGFYVYRNRRLVIWGTWFRLVPKQEFFKLTRVQVDIPNTFDDLWSLDIKKSAAQPPEVIRNRLTELIPHFAETSKRTVTYPGRRTGSAAYAPVWTRSEPGHGRFRYDVNRDHPTLVALAGEMDESQRRQLDVLLELISSALPLDGIYADMCSDRRSRGDDHALESLVRLASSLHEATGMALSAILDTDPFIRHPGLRDRIIQKVQV